MQNNSENIGRNFWLRWMLANAVGLALGYGLFALIQDIIGGESGSLRHDIGSLVGLTLAGAVIGLLQWFVLRSHVQQYRSAKMGLALVPVVTFIIFSSLGVALLEGITAGLDLYTIEGDELVPALTQIFGALALGVAAALILVRLALQRQIDLAGWGIFASSLAFSTGFFVGFAIAGPPADFVLGILMVGLAGGIVQWLAMREGVKRAGWWVPANTLGMTAGALVGLVIVFASAEAVLGVAFLDTDLGFAVVMTIFGALAGAVGGAITGAVLVRLLRDPASEEQAAAVGASQADA